MAFWAIIAWAFWHVAVPVALAYTIGQLQQKEVKPPTPEPDELDMPTTKEGKKYTVLFGMAWVENPVVAWWGDVSTTAIMYSYTVRKWFRSKRVYYVGGYHYAMGAHLILTQGQMDGVKQIKVADTVAWPDADDPSVLQADGADSAAIDEGDLFGGYDNDGGIVGTIDFEYGEATQSQNSYLVSILGSGISATRGLTAAVLRQMRFGTSPFPKPWKFLCKRTDILTDGSAQWYIAKAEISNQLNAAHILRECYTNTEWGLGYSVSLFPAAEWEAAADTLYTEGFGLMRKWEADNEDIEDVIKDVLRHIDGLIYQDPTTGELILKLVRDDYDPGTLDEYGDDDIVALEDFTRGAIYEAPDMIWLKYWDALNNKPVSICDHDIALMDMQGGKTVAHEVEYLMITDGALAGKLAARERIQLTSFAATMKIKGKRTMGAVRPGDVIKISSAAHGITSMIVRVLSMNYGSLKEGELTLNCMQDVFSVEDAIYTTPPDSGWSSPYSEPAAAPDRLLMETPFWDIVEESGLSDAQDLDDDAGFLMVAARQPSDDAYDYELLLRDSPTDDFYSDGRGQFTPNGLLNADMPLDAQDVVLTLTEVQGLLDVQVDSYAVVDDEILKVKAVAAGSNQVTVARGCLDTVPAAHSGPDSGGANADRIWFVETIAYVSGREFTATDQPGVKILPRTPRGQFAEGSATARNADAFDSRMVRPYPPGDFKVNGSSYPASFSGEPTISWAHRDRTQQLTEILEHGDAGVGPEAGTTYTLQIYDEGNSLIRTESGLTGTSFTYDSLDERIDSGLGSGDPLNSQLRFVLKSVRAGYDSWQSYDVTVART